jgi:phenylacetate-CoA ligase
MGARIARDAIAPAPDARIEAMPRDALQALQLQRLRATLRNLREHVAPIRSRLDAAGVAAEDVRTLDDVARLPFTTKADLRDHYPFGLLARPPHALARVHASSGTTGKPTVVAYTHQDLDTWAQLMARCLAVAGARRGDLVHNAHGYGLFTGGLGVHYGAERLGAVVVPVSGGSTERQVALITDLCPRVICVTPSYALQIVEVAAQMGVDLSRSSLEVGLFGAEPWSEPMRAEIERGLGVVAHDLYGLSEVMGPGVACECDERAGLHGWEDHFLFEVVDPKSGERVPEGEAGELVVTTLTKEALPMLRYRTRDITRLATARCACGRTHVRILRVTGRNDDMLIVRGVNVYPSQIESALVGQPGLAPHYQIVVERRGHLDHVTVEVEAEGGFSPEHYDDLEHRAIHHLKSLLGLTVDVVVRPPGTFERSTGKAVRVRDLRPKLH